MTSAVSPLPAVVPAQKETAVRIPAEVSRAGLDWLGIARTLLLVLLPCACYWPALDGAFLWDDDLLITKSPLVHSPDGLWQMWFSTAPFDYFPLTNSTFWLEWRLWGDEPLGYHLVNLALHIASALLLWRLLRALRVPGAWFGALLFAVHPVNVASVAWISERKNVLSMVFYLGCLICYVRADDREGRAGAWKMYGAALGLFVLAALSKSSVVMLPCALLLLAWWRRGRVRWSDVVRTIPFFAVSLAAGLLTIWFQYHRTMTAQSLAHADPLPVRIMAAGRAIWFYLGKLLWPHPLAMLYPRWEMSAGNVAGYLWPASVVALLAVLWWQRRSWGRGPVAGIGYFVLTLLPVSGLLHMSYFTYSNVSDHLGYAANPGVLALVAAGLAGWYGRGGRSAAPALGVMIGVAAVLGFGCVLRADDFSTPERLWSTTLAVNPNSFAAHNNLGLVYQERSHRDPRQLLVAEAHFRQALDLGHRLDSAGVNLANVLRMEGRWAESAALYRQVLDAHPDPESFNNYGVALLEIGDTAKAREAFYSALHYAPKMENVYYNLYGIELSQGHLAEACGMLRACLQINPDSVTALTSLIRLSLEQPGQGPLPTPAAETLVALAEHVCHLTQYQDAKSLALLSNALLAANRKPEAAVVAQRAHDAAVAAGQPETAAAIEQYQHTLQP